MKLNAGLNTLRALFIKEKQLQQQYKGVLESINKLTSTSQEVVLKVVQMFFDLPMAIHSVNIIRWYGLYRNDGAYNTDFYFQLYERIKAILETQAKLLKLGQSMFPNRETILGFHKMSQQKQARQSSGIEALFAKVIDQDNEKKYMKKALSKRVTNLFSMALNKKLPVILPEMMKEVAEPINDDIIKGHFEKIGLQLEELTKLNQPVYKMNDRYQDRDFEILDLVYMTLAH